MEYEEAFLRKKIDLRSVIGVVCPVCGAECGFRRISDYHREARELWPLRSGWVSVARFQCRGTPGRWPTFSLLPDFLVPYHKYTLKTMVMAALLWIEYWTDSEEPGTAYQVEQSLPGDGGVTAWRLRCWVAALRSAFSRSQSELADWFDFSGVPFGAPVLDELHGYFEAVSRGPPGRGDAVLACVRRYGRRTGRFLVGTPSQWR